MNASPSIQYDVDQPIRADREELLSRAMAMFPALRERALTTEQNRRLSDETVQQLTSLDLLRVGRPDHFGGYGQPDIDYDFAFEITAELARACPSTGWVYAVWAAHDWIVSIVFSDAAQEEYFSDPHVRCASSFGNVKSGTLEPVEGGFRLKGKFAFSSGCDHSQWNLLGATAPDGPKFVLLPRKDWTIVDDSWHVSGLRGTGSKDIIVDDVFVPAHLVCPYGIHHSTAWARHKRPSTHAKAFPALGYYIFLSVAVGAAHGMLDEFVRQCSAGGMLERKAASPHIQLRLGTAASLIADVRRTMRERCASVIEKSNAGTLNDYEAALQGSEASRIANHCRKVATSLFEVSGGHALFESNPLQRHFRDVFAATLRYDYDQLGDALGRQLLGVAAPTAGHQLRTPEGLRTA
jgi:3-hydroxy-9,10-secoandrosta-1,3,5(10)-triene-9,17-dione monooxygenase